MKDNKIPSSFSDSAMTSVNTNRHATFKIQMKIHCSSFKVDHNVLFNNSSIKPAFLLSP